MRPWTQDWVRWRPTSVPCWSTPPEPLAILKVILMYSPNPYNLPDKEGFSWSISAEIDQLIGTNLRMAYYTKSTSLFARIWWRLVAKPKYMYIVYWLERDQGESLSITNQTLQLKKQKNSTATQRCSLSFLHFLSSFSLFLHFFLPLFWGGGLTLWRGTCLLCPPTPPWIRPCCY